MPRLRPAVLPALAALGLASLGAAPTAPDVAPFVAVSEPVVVLRHVRVIDGTGAPAREDQVVVVAGGKISAVGPAASTKLPAGARVLDYAGHTVLPGLVGLHDHLYYTASASVQRGTTGRIPEPGLFVNEIPYSAPRLYLAAGVTTVRTTGSLEPYTDLKVKQRIDAGLAPGPRLHLTAPYLEGKPTPFAQMKELDGPDDARRLVDTWAAEGMTSFKAYMNITRAELAAAAARAHEKGLKITGHLCAVSWPEAIAAGIDDLEHGPVFTDSELAATRKPDTCPPAGDITGAWAKQDIGSSTVSALIKDLVEHHVAVTSTLPVFELMVAGRPPLQPRVLEAMSASARDSYLTARALVNTTGSPRALPEAVFRRELEFELAFVRAGGLLLAGSDPTGSGGVLPGFGNQREVELLVEAGFTPVEAIQIATQNGARFLGVEDQLGTVTAGKLADLVLVKGDPSRSIADLEAIELVFKDGVGYDPRKLVESVRGQVGIR